MVWCAESAPSSAPTVFLARLDAFSVWARTITSLSSGSDPAFSPACAVSCWFADVSLASAASVPPAMVSTPHLCHMVSASRKVFSVRLRAAARSVGSTSESARTDSSTASSSRVAVDNLEETVCGTTNTALPYTGMIFISISPAYSSRLAYAFRVVSAWMPSRWRW